MGILFIILAIITFIISILNFVLLKRTSQQKYEIDELKKRIKSNFVERKDYVNKYYRIGDFDKYGLAMTRINKEFEGREKDFYGIIDRFGNEILPPKYHFRDFSKIPYFKHFPIIIFDEPETGKQGVIDIYGNWIIELDKQSIDFLNKLNPSNETWDSHEKYLSINDSSLLDVNDMILEVRDLENGITENTDLGYTTTYEGYYLNKQYERFNMKIVRVLIRD